jgi:hypothetical protein
VIFDTCMYGRIDYMETYFFFLETMNKHDYFFRDHRDIVVNSFLRIFHSQNIQRGFRRDR